MKVLQKSNKQTYTLPPIKRIDSRFIHNNIHLLDEKNHQKWQKIIADYYRFVSKNSPNYLYTDAIKKCIAFGWIPQDYWQRHLMRLLAKGIDIPKRILEQHGVTIYDGIAYKTDRTHTPKFRKPQSDTDFVLADTSRWQEYEHLQRFYDELPDKPYFAECKDGQTLIRPKHYANRYSHVHPFHNKHFALVFDIDEMAGRWAFQAWRECGLLPPHLIIANPVKDSCQYVYFLKIPFTVYLNSSIGIIEKFKLVHGAMSDLLQADTAFNQARMKNPLHSSHNVYVGGAEPYTLAQLIDKCDLWEYRAELFKRQAKASGLKPANDDLMYQGRNHEIFENVRHQAYPNASMDWDSLFDFTFEKCAAYNKRFSEPLPHNELCNIARSITKYCKNGGLNGKYSERFLAFQREQAPKGAKAANAQGANSKGGQARSASYEPKREQAHAMHKQGLKNKVIADTLGISPKTLRNWGIFSKKR